MDRLRWHRRFFFLLPPWSVPRHNKITVAFLCSLFMTIGCHTSENPVAPQWSPPAAGPNFHAAQLIGRQGLDLLLTKYAGQVVMVNYWATWCVPCQKEFPHAAQLQRVYGSDGLQVVTISLDDPTMAAAVNDFLRSYRANFDNFISGSESSEQTIKDFEIENGTLPYFQLYDRQGSLRV